MTTTQSPTQRSDWLWVGIIIALIIIVAGVMWLANSQLTSRMVEVCQNMSMDYSYRDTDTFYCVSRGIPIRLKEIKYR